MDTIKTLAIKANAAIDAHTKAMLALSEKRSRLMADAIDQIEAGLTADREAIVALALTRMEAEAALETAHIAHNTAKLAEMPTTEVIEWVWDYGFSRYKTSGRRAALEVRTFDTRVHAARPTYVKIGRIGLRPLTAAGLPGAELLPYSTQSLAEQIDSARRGGKFPLWLAPGIIPVLEGTK